MKNLPIKKVMLTAAAVGLAGSVFANAQTITISNNLLVSGQQTSVVLLPTRIISQSYSNPAVTCTLNGSTQDLCKNLHAYSPTGVAIPFGRTLTVKVYPLVYPGLSKPMSGVLNWMVAYTENMCGVESREQTNNPKGALDPADIAIAVNSTNYFIGGSSYCG